MQIGVQARVAPARARLRVARPAAVAAAPWAARAHVSALHLGLDLRPRLCASRASLRICSSTTPSVGRPQQPQQPEQRPLLESALSLLKSLRAPALLALALCSVSLVAPDAALAARSGGRIGGSSFSRRVMLNAWLDTYH